MTSSKGEPIREVVEPAASETNTCAWREVWVWTALLSAVFLVGMTEILSAFRALDRTHLVGGWMIGIAGLGLLGGRTMRGVSAAGVRSLLGTLWGRSRFERMLAAGVIGLGLITLTTALMAPPNTWDAMTYHMGRVAHWRQNKSVDVYPTNISRQLVMAPFAEYAILNLQILFDGDRLANLVQWSAMIGNALVCSLIVARLGAGGTAQRWSVFWVMTIPEGILEATGTFTDHVVGFWLCAFVYFLLRFDQMSDRQSMLGMALALGLAVFTKGTAYIWGFSFGVVMVGLVMRRWRGRGLLALGVASMILMIINVPYLLRVHRVYGIWKYSAKVEDVEMENEAMGPALLTSNLLRNLGLHLPATLRGTLLRGLEFTHGLMGVKLNDRRITFNDHLFEFCRQPLHEAVGQNPLHLLLLLAGLLYPCCQKTIPGRRMVCTYAVCSAFGFVLFCALLKWGPWHTRYHLSWFVLSGPLIALFLNDLPRAAWKYGVAGLMLLSAAAPALANDSRSWTPGHACLLSQSREQLYFAQRTAAVASDYQSACRVLSQLNPRTIGLRIDSDDYEYPAWVLVQPRGKADPCQWEHVGVTNASLKVATIGPWKDFVPDCILASRKEFGQTMRLGEVVYEERLSNAVFQVYQIMSAREQTATR